MSSTLNTLTELGHVARIWANSTASKHFGLTVSDARWHRVFNLGFTALSSLHDSDLRPAVRSLLYRLGNVPLAASAPETWPGEDPNVLLTKLDEHSATHGDPGPNAFASAARDLLDSALPHPLWNIVQENWARFDKPTCLIVGRTSVVPRVEAIAAQLPGRPIVLAPNEYLDMRFRSSAIIFGSPKSYPHWMKVYPRLTCYWVHFDWHQPPVEPEPFLIHGNRVGGRLFVERLLEPQASTGTRLDTLAEEEVWDPIDWQDFRQHLVRTTRTSDQDEEDVPIAAIAAALSDNRVVLLPLEARTTVYDPDTGAVKGAFGNELRVGQFVILREGKDRDFFRQLVEAKFLPKADEARRKLSHWKGLLRNKIRHSGLDKVVVDLRSMGVVAAPMTIRTWGTGLIYGPGSESTFKQLLTYLGVQNHEEHWKVVEAYRSAGSKAGHYVRSTLLQQIENLDPSIARHESTIHLTLEGVDEGGLVAHKLEAVHDQRYEVDSRRVGSVLSVGDL